MKVNQQVQRWIHGLSHSDSGSTRHLAAGCTEAAGISGGLPPLITTPASDLWWALICMGNPWIWAVHQSSAVPFGKLVELHSRACSTVVDVRELDNTNLILMMMVMMIKGDEVRWRWQRMWAIPSLSLSLSLSPPLLRTFPGKRQSVHVSLIS